MANKHIELVGEFPHELLDKLLETPNVEISHSDTFTPSATTPPDLLVIPFSGNYQATLQALNKLPAEKHPLLLAVLPQEDSQLLRRAMHAGASDFLVQPTTPETLLKMARDLLHATDTQQPAAQGKITSVFSTSSNMDAGFISGNLAHIAASRGGRNVTLMDLNMQFSSLPLMFDLMPERSISEALEVVDTLDEMAINAYCVSHASGLRLMATQNDEVLLPGEVNSRDTLKLISLAARSSDDLFINLPGLIDPLTTQVMEKSDQIVIVVQQSFGSLNHARGLLNILIHELEIPALKIRVLINRFRTKSKISQQAIQQALEVKNMVLLPIGSAHVREAGQYHLLLQDNARHSGTTEAMTKLVESLCGIQIKTNGGLFERLLTSLGGTS